MAASDANRRRRVSLVTALRSLGISSEPVLAALERVPRERFLPERLAERAYEDAALPIDCGQTISQPYMVARMTELLELSPRTTVLEIGTGSGYQTAVLARLAARVFTIEWHMRLLTEAAERLRELDCRNVTYRCGDGSVGWPEHAPFDAMLVTAGAPDVPAALTRQLADGGRLVAPVGPLDDQVLVRVVRRGDTLTRTEILRCRFVKLLGAEGWNDDRRAF